MRIISKAKHTVTVSFHAHFGQPDDKGRVRLCAGFECSENGNIVPLTSDEARRQLASCIAGIDGIVPMGLGLGLGLGLNKQLNRSNVVKPSDSF